MQILNREISQQKAGFLTIRHRIVVQLFLNLLKLQKITDRIFNYIFIALRQCLDYVFNLIIIIN
jgi:hypothetical protein